MRTWGVTEVGDGSGADPFRVGKGYWGGSVSFTVPSPVNVGIHSTTSDLTLYVSP